jgi:hypothetical protein
MRIKPHWDCHSRRGVHNPISLFGFLFRGGGFVWGSQNADASMSCNRTHVHWGVGFVRVPSHRNQSIMHVWVCRGAGENVATEPHIAAWVIVVVGVGAASSWRVSSQVPNETNETGNLKNTCTSRMLPRSTAQRRGFWTHPYPHILCFLPSIGDAQRTAPTSPCPWNFAGISTRFKVRLVWGVKV